MLYLLTLFCIIFCSFWRRWFGGGFKNTWLGNNRAVQCIVFILTMILCIFMEIKIIDSQLSSFSKIFLFLTIIAFSVLSYCQFWARGHGSCFDIGRGKPDETTIKRYNARWYHIPCDKLLKDHKYGFLYDFLYMGLRYTMPMILIYLLGLIPLCFGFSKPIFSIHLVIIGLLISPIYAFCWTLYENESWFFQKYWSVVGPTNLAEYLAGGIFGFFPLTLN